MSKRDAVIKELVLKIELLTNDYQMVARLQTRVTLRDVKLTALCVALMRSTKAIDAMTWEHPWFQSELDALLVAGRRREGLSRNVLERSCTSYNRLTHTNSTSYCNSRNDLRADGQ